MKQPRLIEDHEIELMLSIADFQLDHALPFVGLVRDERGTGVIAARHPKTFGRWLDARRDKLKRDDFSVVVVAPEAIYRAVLQVVYRFRTPLIRTGTTPDVPSAADAVRAELAPIARPIGTATEGFLNTLLA